MAIALWVYGNDIRVISGRARGYVSRARAGDTCCVLVRVTRGARAAFYCERSHLTSATPRSAQTAALRFDAAARGSNV
jgi:hypothetical protein